MKVFISGKITGEEFAYFKFKNMEKRLLDVGYTVVNPFVRESKEWSYKEYIDMALDKLKMCDAIYSLEGWSNSEGAKLERHYAEVAGLKLMGAKE